MKRTLVTAAALAALALTTLGGVQATANDSRACIPPAVIQALS